MTTKEIVMSGHIMKKVGLYAKNIFLSMMTRAIRLKRRGIMEKETY